MTTAADHFSMPPGGPRISARARIIDNGLILLSKHEDDRGFWYVTPGGGQRAGETLTECLLREVREELCIEIEIGEMLFVREIIAARHDDAELPREFHQVEVFFDCRLSGGEPALGDHPDPDQVGFEWVEIDRLKDILFFPRAVADRIADPGIEGAYLGEIR